VVVTLEPHDHHGRTPPCTEALIAAGVGRVAISRLDPNPEVSGAGVARLRRAGIEVVTDVAPEVGTTVDPGYFHWWGTGLPRVILKTASTLDGQTAAADGTSRWITSEEARQDAHRLRSEVDAVMVGSGTVLSDDPHLDVRLPGYEGHQPRPVLVLGERRLPLGLAVLAREPIVVAPRPAGYHDEIVAPGRRGVDLKSALRALGERGVFDVLVEGGATLAGALWEAGLVSEGVTYIAAAFAGGLGRSMFDRTFSTLSDLRRIDITDVSTVGPDVRIAWRVRETDS